MKSIKQEDNLGCSIACVAFICKTNYNTAKKKYFKNLGNAKKTGFYCTDIVKALSRANKKYNYKYIKRNLSKTQLFLSKDLKNIQ